MDIDSLPTIELKNIDDFLSKKRGMYFWFDQRTNRLVYIGIAVGVGGLRKRIISQHLNPKYLEYRPEKHTKKDSFQLQYVVRVSRKAAPTLLGIDKSAFRKSIGRKLYLKPGNETVDYIIDNLYLRIYESEDIDGIKALEKLLIGEHQPQFNTTYKTRDALISSG